MVLATQGPSDLEAVDRALLPQVLQETAWQLAFRQGSPHDARQLEALFGQGWVKDESWRSDGMTTTRLVERPRVRVDEWMNGLEPGDAWLRVAPIDRGWRQVRVRVAMPRPPELSDDRSIEVHQPRIEVSDRASDTKAGTTRRHYPSAVSETRPTAPRVPALPAVPPDCPAELLERMGADVLGKVERRWPRRWHALGPCLVWRDGEPTIKAAGGVYGRIYDVEISRSDYPHRVVWRRVYGPIPRGLTVDHKCNVTLCQRPDHLRLLTRAGNTRAKWARGRS
ncbi:MAG: HNH endonuclease [Chloroflexi bacterium]|nr:HNH endonuclease [Chloroflexota bacterium]